MIPVPLIVVSALALAVTIAIVLWIRRKDRHPPP